MARDGNGTYTAPVNTWNPATNGVLATAGDWQQLLNDIVAALTQSVSRDGQTPMTGNLALGNHKITGLTAGTGTGEALAFQQLFNHGTMADIASAATTDIGVQNTNFLRVTGTTTITSFGTNYRGPRFLVFAGAVTLTNSTTLVLPGNANITTAAGDVLIAIPGATLGTADKWIVAAYQRRNDIFVDGNGNVGIGTSAPGQKLDVDGNIQLRSGNRIGFFNQNYFIRASSGLEVQSPDFIRFLTDGANERMRIDSAGNVGIGTSAPADRLTVFGGNQRIQNDVPTIRLRSSGDVNRWYIGANISDSVNGGLHFGSGDGVGGTLRMALDSSGNFQFNSGYGSVATAYGCRAWVNFNGTGTVAIRASGNVSSVTRDGTGLYTINFATALPDKNYAFGFGYSYAINTGGSSTVRIRQDGHTASACPIALGGGGVTEDSPVITVQFFR